MELSMTMLVDVEHTLRELAYVKGGLTPLQRNDVIVCLFPDKKVYVGVVGSDHTVNDNGNDNDNDNDIEDGNVMVHDLGMNTEVDIMWARPVETYTSGKTFTTYYIPPGVTNDDHVDGDGVTGESSLVARDSVHIVRAAAYDESTELITMPCTLRVIVTNLMRVAKLQAAGGYPDYTKWNDKFKWDVNKVLAQKAERARVKCGNVKTTALFLDGPAAITSNTMLAYTRYTADAMFSPNCDWAVCREISAATAVYAPHTTLEKFLSYDNLPQFSHVWVDGMGTWVGNATKGHSVRDAVRILFTNKHLARFASIAYTVSIRGRPGVQATRARADMNAHMRVIKKWAFTAGYTVTSNPVLFHNPGGVGSQPGVGNMMTVSFTVTKVTINTLTYRRCK